MARPPIPAYFAALLLVNLALVPASVAQPEPSFRWLGTEENHARAYAVSADGSTVVGRFDLPLTEAFRWTEAGGFELLGHLPGTSISQAFGVSGDGSVVVGESTSKAFRWTESTGMEDLGHLPGDGVISVATGISADGTLIAGYSDSEGRSREAFRWSAQGGMVGLEGLAPGRSSLARAISGNGDYVVGVARNEENRSEAFRWDVEKDMLGLGGDPSYFRSSEAHAVSSDGSIVVGRALILRRREAFLWTAASGMVALGGPGDEPLTTAYGVSDNGIVVGSGFIWDEHHGMRPLNDVFQVGVDENLIEARAITPDGNTIVGWGQRDGRIDGWIATIPEPSAASILLIAFAFARRRF